MARKTLGLLAVVVLALVSASCSRELKPDRKGVWAVSHGVLVELKQVAVDTEWTEEGFAIPYFSGDSPTVKEGDFYFILYGEYQVTDLKAFKQGRNRWEIDTEITGLNTQLETLGMKGEPEMRIARFTKMLHHGVFVLEARQGGRTLSFPFTVSSGY
jgi:hypothetical protein